VTTLFLRRAAFALVAGGVMIVPTACVAPGPAGGYDNSVGLGVDYYAPYYGGDYGGWDTGYLVGPYHHHHRGGDHDRGEARAHSYRSAPASHPVPSIPSGSRGGGGFRR
jgi:hypothetical protein